MMKPFYKTALLLLVILCAVLQAPAQMLTAASGPLSARSYAQKFKPLAVVLSDLSARYNISLNYDSELVAQKLADASILNVPDEGVDHVLARLLATHKLKYEKLNADTYLILPVGSEQSIKTPEKSEKRAAVNVSGKVTDENGAGLPGVTVALKGTSAGTATDAAGDYTLNVPDGQENGTLVFSFIGYTTQEVSINSRSTINVQLAPDVQALQEVVVIGYQTVRKSDLTGAVSVINPAAASRVTATSVAESIQGLAPGVTIRNAGAPGAGATVEIRGVASFTDSNPLYVIDGMIADANPTINTNDIASIQILKDASAAAIYGSRAANGVIIITTKQGTEGPARISLSAKYGLQQIPKRWDLTNSTEFAAMQRMQYQNSGLPIPPSVASAPTINTDWQDEVMRTGNMQDYNLTLSGGSQTGTYLVSGSYFANEGVLIGNSFERVALRVNTRSQKGRVTLGENLMLSNSTDKAPREGNPFLDAPQMLPVIPVRGAEYISATNSAGWGIGIPNVAETFAWNSVAVADLATRKSNFAKLVGNAFVEVKLSDWLSYKFNAGAEASYDFTKNIRKVGVWQMNAAVYPSSVDEERSRFYSLLLEHTLNFNKVFGSHSINGVVGYSNQRFNRETTLAGRTNLQIYNGNYYTTIGSATGDPTSDGGIPVDYRNYGYLGRINYTFADRYLLTFTGRVDQDSRFGENYRTGFFPSVAAAWRISEEDFFNVGWLSDLKLNASYGELGIVPLSSWAYTAFINSNPRTIFGPDQGVNVGSIQAQLANADLKWEERIVKNIGIDATLLNNKLSLSVEAYNSLSKDNLLALPVGGYLGNLGGNPFVNAGSIRNTGFELSATYRSFASDLQWDVSANATTIKNKVEDVGNRGEGINYIQIGNTRTQVGRSLGEWYLLQTDGLFQSENEVNSYINADGTIIQPNAKPGDVRYIDQNGDGVIDAQDRRFAGSPWPTLQTGAQFNASYKQFNLNIQLIGVFGNELYNAVRLELDDYQRTNFRRDVSPWSPTNTGTKDPRIGVDIEQGIIENNWPNSDRWLENGSYVRLRNVELGYSLPESLINRAGVQNARVFVSGQNLFTITEYTGLDPDVVGNGLYERGLDNGNWPSSRVFSFGVQLGF